MAPAKKSLSKDGPVVSRLARSGLFTKLLAICTLAAVVYASAATLTFYLYLDAIATNRVAAELNGQASALAPLAADVLAKNDNAAVQRVLKEFSGLNYITCVEVLREDSLITAWPSPGCDEIGAIGNDRFIDVPLGNAPSLTFALRIDDAVLRASIWRETAIFAGFVILLSSIIFTTLMLSFRRTVLFPLEDLRAAMLASTPQNPVRAALYRHDEIGAIVQAYNSLVAAARLFFRRLDRSQAQLANSEKRFRDLAEVSGDWFFEMDHTLRLTFISDQFYSITGLSPDDVIGKTRQKFAANDRVTDMFASHIADLKARREFRGFEYQINNSSGISTHVSISGVPLFDDEGNFKGYRGVGVDVSKIKEKERQLAETNRNLGDSVTYASSIQRVLLAPGAMLDCHLGKADAIWQPKDLVGGDFYLVKTIGKVDYLVFFDCTGHGVPGAFMTLIVTSVVDQIAVSDAAIPAAHVLQLIHDGVCRQLGITPQNPGNDGLDCAVVRLDRSKDLLEFSGASIDLFEVAVHGGVTRHRGARVTLGYQMYDAPLELSATPLVMADNAFVLTTDGLLTQVGDRTKRALGTRRFQEGLAAVNGNDPGKLIRAAGRILKNWQGREDRRDDVAVVAFKPNHHA
ncbi:MAG: PAS domain S-box protein [Bacteroidetes bacterium]|nr:PAS domain S-box protein [Bacteroidota bacterium]